MGGQKGFRLILGSRVWISPLGEESGRYDGTCMSGGNGYDGKGRQVGRTHPPVRASSVAQRKGAFELTRYDLAGLCGLEHNGVWRIKKTQGVQGIGSFGGGGSKNTKVNPEVDSATSV